MTPEQSQYDALNKGVGLARLDRAQVEVVGKDRVRLLQGLCTNDIKRLGPGDGCEAFLTNAQGHTIGHVYVFHGTETLVIETVSGAGQDIIRSLDRYVVREDVRFVDRSGEWSELLVGGPGAAELISGVLGSQAPEPMLGHREIQFDSAAISVRRTPLIGPHCFQLSGAAPVLAAVSDRLIQAGAQPCQSGAVESARVEAGTPIFGRDITDDNLPQEVDRDHHAISFTKGCYLGQETVARIDSLGHVNRKLRGLRFEGVELPPAGAEIQRDGKVVATITSVGYSPRLRSPLAMAYVRRGHNQAGARFPSRWGEVEVLQLPVLET